MAVLTWSLDHWWNLSITFYIRWKYLKLLPMNSIKSLTKHKWANFIRHLEWFKYFYYRLFKEPLYWGRYLSCNQSLKWLWKCNCSENMEPSHRLSYAFIWLTFSKKKLVQTKKKRNMNLVVSPSSIDCPYCIFCSWLYCRRLHNIQENLIQSQTKFSKQ